MNLINVCACINNGVHSPAPRTFVLLKDEGHKLCLGGAINTRGVESESEPAPDDGLLVTGDRLFVGGGRGNAVTRERETTVVYPLYNAIARAHTHKCARDPPPQHDNLSSKLRARRRRARALHDNIALAATVAGVVPQSASVRRSDTRSVRRRVRFSRTGCHHPSTFSVS